MGTHHSHLGTRSCHYLGTEGLGCENVTLAIAPHDLLRLCSQAEAPASLPYLLCSATPADILNRDHHGQGVTQHTNQMRTCLIA